MKKFFKILMVLALLSGAALSCTKDYSKEIADVQKQNQDLQALVASLQNALNSTNATVSQLNSTSDKQAADIAKIVSDINAQKGDISALMADVETIEALSEVFAQLGVDLSKEIEDQALLIAALQAQAKELEEGIETVEGKATANAAAIAKIDETLKGIASTLDLLEEGMTAIEANKTAIAANKTAIEANKTAIETAQADLAKIKEQIKSLSARLTNIVAAPAKDVELQGIEFAGVQRTKINMNFVVAPASAAEAIEAGFGEGVDVKLALTNGIARSSDTLNVTVIPDKVTAGEKGAINVYAVIDTILKVKATEKIFASLVVSGKDEAGEFERISEPVAVITGDTQTIEASSFKWYKGDKEVPTFDGKIEDIDHSKDSVFVEGNSLCIVAADVDYQTLPSKKNDVIADYALKVKVGNKALTIQELAAQLAITEDVTPHFVPVPVAVATKATPATKVVYGTFVHEQTEWDDFKGFGGAEADDDIAALFEVKADSTSTVVDLTVKALAEKPEEAVGAVLICGFTEVAFGKLSDNTDKSVFLIQRIGKHVTYEEVADPIEIEFGLNQYKNAQIAYKFFEALEWKSTSQLIMMDHIIPALYTVKDGKVGDMVPSKINIYYSTGSKFIGIDVKTDYTDKEQKLWILWNDDIKINTSEVVAEEYNGHIDLTVAPYHAPVNIEYTDKAFYLSRKTGKATIKTDATVKKIFSDIDEWVIGKAETPEDSAKVYSWFDENKFTSFKQTVSQGKNTGANVGTTTLKFVEDTLCVDFEKGSKFVEGEPVTVTLKDSINDVIKFNYTIIINTVKPGVKIATIPGFVNDKNEVEVAGKIVADKYVINDINLSQYYKVENLTAKAEEDVVKVTFGVDKKVTGLDIPAGVSVSEKGTLDADAKIKWNDFKNTQFVLTAYANVHDGKTDSVEVTYWTPDPIKKIDPVALTVTTEGKDTPVKLFDTPKKGLKIFSILDSKNSIYPEKLGVFGGVIKIKEMKDWGCKVGTNDNYPLEQMKQLFTLNGNELTIKAHDAVGEIVLTIPCEFAYDLGKKEFNVVITID